MTKLLLVGLMLSLVLGFCVPAQADWHIACDLQDQPEVLSALNDDVRWKYYEECGALPQAPAGYTWAEDLTLVPLSYYEGGTSNPETLLLQLVDTMYAQGDDSGDGLVNAYYDYEGNEDVEDALIDEARARIAENATL